MQLLFLSLATSMFHNSVLCIAWTSVINVSALSTSRVPSSLPLPHRFPKFAASLEGSYGEDIHVIKGTEKKILGKPITDPHNWISILR